jgi:NAD+ kinase
MTFTTILIQTKVGGNRVEDSLRIADDLERHAKIHGFQVIRDLDQVTDSAHTVMIPIGGDGTVLVAAKKAVELDIPIIGVNIGNLGFLTDLLPLDREDSHKFFERLRNPQAFKRDRRTLLTVNICGKEYVAMNEIVVSDRYSDSIVDYDLHVGDSYAGNHKSNGVIISTPTGSTAYALFSGGAIIEPDLDVVEIIHLAAMSMSARPMVVGGKNTIKVQVKRKPGRDLSIKADGVNIEQCWPDDATQYTVEVNRLEKKVTLLHAPEWNFFDLLTTKLHWNHK